MQLLLEGLWAEFLLLLFAFQPPAAMHLIQLANKVYILTMLKTVIIILLLQYVILTAARAEVDLLNSLLLLRVFDCCANG